MPYITLSADGIVAITRLNGADPDGTKLTKLLFSLSRTTDKTTHFDPAIHTREAIAAGIAGHRALALIAEVDEGDIPTDRYFRDAWEWSD